MWYNYWKMHVKCFFCLFVLSLGSVHPDSLGGHCGRTWKSDAQKTPAYWSQMSSLHSKGLEQEGQVVESQVVYQKHCQMVHFFSSQHFGLLFRWQKNTRKIHYFRSCLCSSWITHHLKKEKEKKTQNKNRSWDLPQKRRHMLCIYGNTCHLLSSWHRRT